MPHVVIIGAGFGGLSATEELAKEGFRVTLLDRFPYNTFQPLLYQVATGGLNPGDVTYSLRYFAAGMRASGSVAPRSLGLTMINMR
jgi:NADH dehydrogenase